MRTRSLARLMLTVIICALAFVLCAFSDGGRTSRTIMIYMVGSDLESDDGLASKDLYEIAQSGADFSRVNVVVAAGGTSSWPTLGLSDGEMQVFRMAQTSDLNSLESLDDARRRDMSSASTLSYFIDLATSRCPADRYDLILWNHGGGPHGGYGFDASSHSNMGLPEVATSLKEAGFGPSRHLEMIGYDACLMGSVEVAAMMSPYADYMVASEETVPGSGWNYRFVCDREACGSDTEALLEDICSRYEDILRDDKYGVDYTLSAIRLDRIDAVGKALDDFFYRKAEFSGPQDVPTIAARMNSCPAFGRFSTTNEYDLYDLGGFATCVGDLAPKTSAKLKQALEKCVVHNATNVSRAYGLSFYFPREAPDDRGSHLDLYANHLARQGFAPGYAKFLDNFETSPDSSSPESLGLPTMQGTIVPGAPTYELQLSREQHERFASGVYYILTPYEDSPDCFRCIELNRDLSLSSSGVLSASRDRKFHWLRASSDPEGWETIPVYFDERRDDAIRFSMQAILFRCPVGRIEDWKTGLFELQLETTPENPAGQIMRLVPNTDDEMAPRSLLELETDDILSFVTVVMRPTFDKHGNLLPYGEWEKYNPNGTQGYELTMDEHGLETAYMEGSPDTEYYIQIVSYDTDGNGVASELMPLR